MSWHYKRYKRNKELFEQLRKNELNCYDWQVTILFYAALHLVNDFFERNGYISPDNRKLRKKIIKNISHI